MTSLTKRSAAAAAVAKADSVEVLDQKITATLQAIDADFVKARELAVSILSLVKTHNMHVLKAGEGVKVLIGFVTCLSSTYTIAGMNLIDDVSSSPALILAGLG